ncbi:MAG: hypothetical protein HYX53_10215 [Chloroflexi bacterium]|nr:hypothetical protein [Chloroflexota bacterium]
MQRLRLAVSIFGFVLLTTLSACSTNGTPPPTATATASPSPAASSTATAPGTAEALPPALQKILNDVASVRELSPPPSLTVRFVPRAGVLDLLNRLTTDDDRRWYANTTTLYRLLGHLGKDADYQSTFNNFGGTAVLGVYSPLDDALWLVQDGGASDLDNLPRDTKETLAHELVHAIQDSRYQLDKQYLAVIGDLDRQLAWTALVEGDAVTEQRIYAQKFLALPVGSGGARALLASVDAGSQAGVPPSMAREFLFPYTAGANWVKGLRDNGGTAAINAVFEQGAPATSVVLHPTLFPPGWKPAEVNLPDLSRALGDGWSRQSGGTFGEFEIQNYLQLRIGAGTAASAATGWAGDRYDVYVKGTESVAAFRLRFSSEDEAAQFAAAQDSFLKAGGGAATVAAKVTLWTAANGTVTATAARASTDVLFAIATSADAAQKTLAALIQG